jgi:hypothetical protein
MWNRKSLENCALLGYYATCCGNSLPTFRDNLLRILDPERLDPLGCPETSVRNYHSTLYNIPEKRRSHKNRGGSLKPCIGVLSLAQTRVGAE